MSLLSSNEKTATNFKEVKLSLLKVILLFIWAFKK